jgi:hypothetical protein
VNWSTSFILITPVSFDIPFQSFTFDIL